MARSIEQIQDEIVAEKDKRPELAALDSTSKVALWRLWAYVTAVCIHVHEKVVERNADNSRPHTLRWYREQAMAFQDGHVLVWRDGRFAYPRDDAGARIVHRCAVGETPNGELQIKVATIADGAPRPIGSAQLGRFKSYLAQIKDAGNRIAVVNRAPDLLAITIEAHVDDQAFDLDDGSLVSAPGTKPVEEAVHGFLELLEFNGAFVRTFFKDHLQEVEGVKLPLVKSVKWRYGGFDFAEIGEWQVPDAGYFEIDALDIEYKKYAV